MLRDYVVEMMRAEWAEGRDIGKPDVILDVGRRIGMDPGKLEFAIDDPARLAVLEANWQEARTRDVFGVPSFFIGDQVFWGNDRIDFAAEHLREMRLARL